MKIIYFDMTKFCILKSFYENGDYQIRNHLINDFKVFGRKDEYLE